MMAYKTVGTILKSEFLSENESDIIIGIDPGLKNLGIGIIQVTKDLFISPTIIKKKTVYDVEERIKLINGYCCNVIKFKQNRNIEDKLFFIYQTLCEVFETFKPKMVIVEDAFVGINKNSALTLGLARGAILTAIGKHKIPVETIAPKKIKMELTKRGNAEKNEIQEIFAEFLVNWSPVSYDASDALAAAICGIR